VEGALRGIRVVELANYVSGPFASLLLADLGADVIKLEQPGRGDPFRGWGDRNYSATFCSLNRNKKSFTLDVRRREGRDIFFKIAEKADVLIENFRPGTMEGFGLGYEVVERVNPKMVYCSISGFGQAGPYRNFPGYDSVGQAMSGLLSLLTDSEKPKGMGISLSDHLAGIYACYGILAALVSRQITGKGQRVETSLLRASVSFSSENAARYFETGVVPRRANRTRTAGVFVFVDQEGEAFVVHLSSAEKFWLGLIKTVSHPEWADDERFRERKDRIQNHDILEELLQGTFQQGRREEWLRRLQENDVPCGPLHTLGEVFQDPQVQGYGFPIEVEHPQMGKVRMVGSGVELSRTPPQVVLPPPVLGEHTEGLLRDLGFDPEAIGQLKKDGVV